MLMKFAPGTHFYGLDEKLGMSEYLSASHEKARDSHFVHFLTVSSHR